MFMLSEQYLISHASQSMLAFAFNFYIASLLETIITTTIATTITSTLTTTTANQTDYQEAPVIETGLRLFFLKDGIHPTQTSDFESFYGTSFKKLVILLSGVHLLEKVTVKVQCEFRPNRYPFSSCF